MSKKKRRDNWRELAQACETSGMTIYGWCKSNNIPYTTCRKWLERLREEQFNPKGTQQELSIWGKVEMNQSLELLSATSEPAPMKLNYGMWGIEISHGFDPVLLKQIIKVVETQC